MLKLLKSKITRARGADVFFLQRYISI